MSPQWQWVRDNGDMATLTVCGPLGGKRSLLSIQLISACIISVFLEPNLSLWLPQLSGAIHQGHFRLVLFVAPAHRYIHLVANIYSSS